MSSIEGILEALECLQSEFKKAGFGDSALKEIYLSRDVYGTFLARLSHLRTLTAVEYNPLITCDDVLLGVKISMEGSQSENDE